MIFNYIKTSNSLYLVIHPSKEYDSPNARTLTPALTASLTALLYIGSLGLICKPLCQSYRGTI